MTATSGYQAGVEANQTVVSYAAEVVWGTAPAVPFKAIRLTAESLSSTKKRDRPAEFNTNGEVQTAITSQVSAGGDLTFALSFGVFDDLLAGALDNDWGAVISVSGVAGDITMSNAAGGTAQLQSTTAGKYTSMPVTGWVRTTGFTNAVNNGVWRVTANSGMVLQIATGTAVTVTEAPAGTAATVSRGSSVTNGTVFKSFFVQKQFSSALFLNYPGSYVSDFMLSGGTGKFLNGTFTLLSQVEKNAITNSSTGAVTAAPTGRVHDPVGGFQGVYLNGALISSVVDSFSLTGSSSGAALEFGMGSAAAQGVLAGLLEVKGSLKAYFKDFSLYTLFLNETFNTLEFATKDAAGNLYSVTILQAALMNPKIVAGSQNTAVMATFDIEGNPQSAGGTITIVRL